VAKTYRDAGVDIQKGDRFVEFIRGMKSPAISRNIGGFSGGFEIDVKRYTHPIISTTTDGVGTKIMIAQKLNVYDTLGIDLVAMCVNDLITSGSRPVSFLDYIACGKINESVMEDLLSGIVAGCEIAACTLAGGETAEMPDMYGEEDFDLAGFAVGIAEKGSMLPIPDAITDGDLLYGLPSSGIHSNGFSLARKALSLDDERILRELITPTKIYVSELETLLASRGLVGAAHITGGGLEANIQRILPGNTRPVLNYSWNVPWIFREIQQHGEVSTEEMRKVYNLGIGMALVVKTEESEDFEAKARASGIDFVKIGEVVKGDATHR